jgi:hypothetical protein
MIQLTICDCNDLQISRTAEVALNEADGVACAIGGAEIVRPPAKYVGPLQGKLGSSLFRKK